MNRNPLDLAARYKFELGVFLVFFMITSVWSVATPLHGTPDEGTHMVRASALTRGQLHGSVGENGGRFFMVPNIYASTATCYELLPTQPADCLDIPADVEIISVQSRAASYPPVWHMLIGGPSRFTRGVKSLYLMRFTHSFLCSIALTLALRNVRLLPRRGPVALGMAIAMTPMVLFLSGPVNPSGMAVACALAIWTAALLLLDKKVVQRVSVSAASLAIPFCMLLMTRRDSLVWGGAIVLLILVLAPTDRIAELLRDRAVVAWIVLVGLVAVAQHLIWTSRYASNFSGGAAAVGGGSAHDAYFYLAGYVNEAIGVFGLLDTRAPTIVYFSWRVLLAAIFFAGIALGSRRQAAAVALSVLMIIGMVTYIGSVRFPYFQGRYLLPLGVGMPILAGYAIASGSKVRFSRRFVYLSLGLIFTLHQVAFAQHMRRYAVGVEGTWYFVTDHAWSPPFGPIWLHLVLYALATGALCAVLGRLALTANVYLAPQPQVDNTSKHSTAS